MNKGIEAGKAFVKFYLDDKEFKSKLTSISKKLTKFGSIGAAATAPLVAGFTASISAFVSAGDALDKMSGRTGVSVEALSELTYAAGQSGTSIESIEKAIKRMQVGILDADKGTGTLSESLGQLGVDLNSLKQQTPEEQFLTLSRAVANVEDPTMRAALAQKVFGRAGTELLPLLNSGAQGMDDLRQRAHDLGLTMDEEAAKKAAILGDNLDDVKQQLYFMAVQVGTAIAGPLTEFLQWFQQILSKIIAWIEANPTLVRTIAAITAAVAAVSAAMIGFGVILAIITAHPIIAALTLLAAILVGIATYFGLASDGATDFKKSLDKVKVPGASGATDKDLEKQAAKVQADLKAAAATPVAAPVVDQASAERMERESGVYHRESLKWLRETADNTAQLVALFTNNNGFIAGAS